MLKVDLLAYQNALRNRHPFEKILFSLLALFLVLLLKNSAVATFTLVTMATLTIGKAKIPWLYYGKLLILPVTFLLLSVMTLVMTVTFTSLSEEAIQLVSLSSLHVYFLPNEVGKSAGLIIQSLSGVSCLYFLILTTPMNEILYVLSRFKLPTLLLELMMLAYRYIFLLLDTAEEIYLSQASRLGYDGIRTSLHSAGNLLKVLFIKTYQQAKELEISMEARGGSQFATFVTLPHTYARVNLTWLCAFVALVLTVNYFL